MAHVYLRLLGPPQIQLDGRQVELGTRKVVALLAYLAVTASEGHPFQSRAVLAALFWPEADQARASGSLRYALVNLRKQLHHDLFDLTGETVALRPDSSLSLDVALFRNHLAACRTHGHDAADICAACGDRLRAAATLYTGDFLEGFSLRDSPGFDEWHLFQQERLRSELAGGLDQLGAYHVRQQAWTMAVDDAQRRVLLDPLHEPAQRQLIQVYAWAGQRAAALDQYQKCLRTLDEELGAPPEEETTRLYHAIRANSLAPLTIPDPPPVPISANPAPPVAPRPLLNLFPQPTPFVGRAIELTQLVNCLDDPDCRLLTISGPGGMGKTRLAMQVAQQMFDLRTPPDAFAHGIFFVPLAAVSSPELVMSRIADALTFAFHGETDANVQLLNYLRNKDLLLVLDNFEQLLAGVDLLTEILAAAPHVKILVTSREALNLREEWLYPLSGLRFPDPRQAETPTTTMAGYDAVSLFTQHARRALPAFSLSTEIEHVIHICQLVEGMPLAIELAAAWLRVLSCNTIADELQRGLDLLESSLRNMPERHRSIRVVFAQSWRLLSVDEARLMARLSVFRGGFERVAAEQVAGVERRTLARLVEQSLLRVAPSGRYHIHELLRQFAEEKLAVVPQAQATAQQRHSEYYLTFLALRAQALHTKQQLALLAEIGQELDNINLGWRWAASQGQAEWINQALDSLYEYYLIRSRYTEGITAFDTAIQLLKSSMAQGAIEQVVARLQARQGAFLYLLGRHEQARALIQDSLAVARRLDGKREIAFCLNVMGRMVWWQESVLAAVPLLEESLALSREIDDQLGLITTLHSLSWLFGGASEPQKAQRFAQESLAISRQIGHTYHVAHALNRLSATAFVLGEYATAVSHCHQSLAVFRQLGDRYGKALVLGELGRSMYASGAYARAAFLLLLEEGAALSRESGNHAAMYHAIGILGKVSNFIGEHEVGRRCGQELVDLLPDLSYPYLPHCLIILGWGCLGLGDYQVARQHLQGAVAAAVKVQFRATRTLPWALLAWAQLLRTESDLPDVDTQPGLPQQKQEQALRMVSHVLSHPHAWPFWKERAKPLAAELEALLPTEIAAAAKARGASSSLEQIANEILTEDSRI